MLGSYIKSAVMFLFRYVLAKAELRCGIDSAVLILLNNTFLLHPSPAVLCEHQLVNQAWPLGSADGGIEPQHSGLASSPRRHPELSSAFSNPDTHCSMYHCHSCNGVVRHLAALLEDAIYKAACL